VKRPCRREASGPFYVLVSLTDWGRCVCRRAHRTTVDVSCGRTGSLCEPAARLPANNQRRRL